MKNISWFVFAAVVIITVGCELNNGEKREWPFYYVRYEGNGALEGIMQDSIHKYGIEKNLSDIGFTWKCMEFSGWAEEPDGSVHYDNSEKVVNLTDEVGAIITLYARWIPAVVPVEGGSFDMGKNPGSAEGSDVMPVHAVTVSDFLMGKYQVTQSLYKAITGMSPSHAIGSNLPAENVSWYDAVNFCNLLSVHEGFQEAYTINETTVSWNPGANGYRLPTEAEWEYAARGGGTGDTSTYSGSNTVGNVAWYSVNSMNISHQAGGKNANGLGIFDMSGNVWEWCWDIYGAYTGDEQTNPAGPASGDARVIRGGDFSSAANFQRVNYRNYTAPDDSSNTIGFRLARNADTTH